MKKNFKKAISVVLLVCMMASLACYYPVSATEANATGDGWTYIDLENDYTAYWATHDLSTKTNVYSYSVSQETGTNAQMMTIDVTQNKAGNGGFYTNTTLEAGKNYLISTKVKYENAYATQDDGTKTLNVGLLFGVTPSTSATASPWDTANGGGCYSVMFMRDTNVTDGKFLTGVKAFQMASANAMKGISNTALSVNHAKTVQWVEISAYVLADGTFYMFVNGVCYGYASTASVSGGRLGIVTHTQMPDDPVHIKELRYKEVTDTAVSETSYHEVNDFVSLANVAANQQTLDKNKGWLWFESETSAEDGSKIMMYDHDKVNPASNGTGSVAKTIGVSLKPGNAYTIEAQVKFAEAYVSGGTAAEQSKAIGVLIGNLNENGDKPYANFRGEVIWLDRSVNQVQMKTLGLYNYPLGTGAISGTNEAMASSTDWLTLRITIAEDGTWTLYLDGQQMATTKMTHYVPGIFGEDTMDLAFTTAAVGSQVYFKNVWYAEGTTTAERENFNYVGTSIRYATDGTSGIRVKTFISNDILENNNVVEYGTLVALADGDYITTLTKGAAGVACAVAYSKADGVDKYFERNEDGTIYTVALYNIEDATQHYAFRAYYVIEDAEGNQTVCYLNAYGNANQNIKSLADVAQMIKDSGEYDTLSTDKKDYIDSILPTA